MRSCLLFLPLPIHAFTYTLNLALFLGEVLESHVFGVTEESLSGNLRLRFGFKGKGNPHIISQAQQA